MTTASAHKPTTAMQAAATRGLDLVARDSAGITHGDLEHGKRIAAGQALTDDHVRQLRAHFTSSAPEDGSARHLLLGGEAGRMWVTAKARELDLGVFADAPALMLDDTSDLSFEIFLSPIEGEPVLLDSANKDLIWAPILRSGMLACRPGPNGEKLPEPLVFVAGHSDDQQTQIGIQDIVDAFDDGAIQHVTLPTTHDNDVLSNTGYIRRLKVVESKTCPGEVVLMAAHDFTEPEVKGKIERGSIPNRSCGLLYDYVNTETGKLYPIALDHVALTPSPWVTGMAPYGGLAEEDLSERQVVPMFLSESGLQLASGVVDKPWDGSPGRFTDSQYRASCLIKGKGKDDSHLPIKEPDGALNRNGIHAAAGRLNQVKGVSADQKRAAAKKLVSLYKNTLKESPPAKLVKMTSASTQMSQREIEQLFPLADVQWGGSAGPSLNWIQQQLYSVLNDMRKAPYPYGPPYFSVIDVTNGKALICCDFDSDGDDYWVAPFEVQGEELVLASLAEWTPVEQVWVEQEGEDVLDVSALEQIFNAPPQGGAGNYSELQKYLDTSKLALVASPSTEPGGRMSTSSDLDKLGLSDEAKTFLAAREADRQREHDELVVLRKERRKDAVTVQLSELKGQGFEAFPGLLVEIEALKLGDLGQAAAKLSLSEGGTVTEVQVTLSEAIDRILKCFPRNDEGKLALSSGHGNLLESPLTQRPDLETPKSDANKPKTGDELLAEWQKVGVDPTRELGIKLAQSA